MSLPKAGVEKLAAYAELLVKWNRGMNLISRRDIDRLVPRHLLDSLTGAEWVVGAKILDIGTGPGLPGIPLAIAHEDKAFTLCDRMAKRLRFLQVAINELNLSNVALEEKNIAVNDVVAEGFDTIVARGVAQTKQLWPVVKPYLNPGGRVIVYSHVAQEQHALAGAEPSKESQSHPEYLMEEVAHQLPGLAQAHYLQILTAA